MTPGVYGEWDLMWNLDDYDGVRGLH